MKKKSLYIKSTAILMAACLTMGLAACGHRGQGGEQDPPQTNPGQEIQPSNPGQSGTEPSSDPGNQEPTDADGWKHVHDGIGIIYEREEKDGKLQSYLTGEWIDAKVATRRPMAVMVGNNKGGLPQYGIGNYSIMYEAPMEYGANTRLMPVIEDYDDVEFILPMRSSRLYFIFESMSLDAIYCNWGLAVPFVASTINSDRVDNISAGVVGIEDPSDEAFERNSERKYEGYATDYTGQMTISGYNSAVKRHQYRTNYREGFEGAYLFAQDGYLSAYEDAGDSSLIKLGIGGNKPDGYSEGQPYFEYNAEDKLYYRFQNGEPQIDAATGEQLTATNVVIQYVSGYYYEPGKSGYLFFDIVDGGESVVFTNGKFIKGRWARGRYDDQITRFYDENMEEIVMNQGKTWVCLVWDEFSSYVSY